jgi:hypothetical protein
LSRWFRCPPSTLVEIEQQLNYGIAARPGRQCRTAAKKAKLSSTSMGTRLLASHDQSGHLILCDTSSRTHDLCDCLRVDCVGCFYACTVCGGSKCAHVCRRNRREIVDYITDAETVRAMRTHNMHSCMQVRYNPYVYADGPHTRPVDSPSETPGASSEDELTASTPPTRASPTPTPAAPTAVTTIN